MPCLTKHHYYYYYYTNGSSFTPPLASVTGCLSAYLAISAYNTKPLALARDLSTYTRSLVRITFYIVLNLFTVFGILLAPAVFHESRYDGTYM